MLQRIYYFFINMKVLLDTLILNIFTSSYPRIFLIYFFLKWKSRNKEEAIKNQNRKVKWIRWHSYGNNQMVGIKRKRVDIGYMQRSIAKTKDTKIMENNRIIKSIFKKGKQTG